LLGFSNDSQLPAQGTPDDTPPDDNENWMVGFDDDVDTALPADDGKKDEWL